jgi:hypothetical protein
MLNRLFSVAGGRGGGNPVKDGRAVFSPPLPAVEIQSLLQIIDEAYGRRAWHGPNLRGSLRGLTAEQALWRGGRHCVAEIVLHCAYWKYAVRRRLRGEKRGSFPLKGSNWFTIPAPFTESAWRDMVRLLDVQHQCLLQAAAELSPAQLDRISKGSRFTPRRHLYGIALHDVYHAGQIQSIKGAHRYPSS